MKRSSICINNSSRSCAAAPKGEKLSVLDDDEPPQSEGLNLEEADYHIAGEVKKQAKRQSSCRARLRLI